MRLVGCEFLAFAALLLSASACAASEVPEAERFPCISVCCAKPTVTTKETVPIRFFVTDRNGSGVRPVDGPPRFDIRIRCVCPDGKVRERTLEKSPAGCGEIELRSQPQGEYHFCVWAVDEKGRESHRAWHRFRVVEPGDLETPPDAVARVSPEDLVKYGITTNFADGLGHLLSDKAKAGIRRVELLRGDYVVGPTNCVSIPGGMTLDLNGATLRRSSGDSAIVVIDGVRDAHLVNGTLDGGRFEFRSDALYCSVEGVAVTNAAGVGVAGGAGRTWYDPIRVASSNDLVGLEGAMKSGWLQLSARDAASAPPSGRLQMVGRWYDGRKKPLSSETFLVNRLVPIPAKAAYLRVEGGEGMALAHYRIPRNCVVKNCDFTGCGDFGYSVGSIGNMRFEGNVFGSCAFRVDRGFDLMQDVAFERNRYGKSLRVVGGGSVTGAEFSGIRVGAANMTECSLSKCEVDAASDGVWSGVKMDGGRMSSRGRTNAFERCRFRGVGFAMGMADGEQTFSGCVFEECRFWGVNGGSIRFEDCKFRGGDVSAGSSSVHDASAKLVFAGCTFDVGEKSFLKVGAHAIGSVLIDKCKADGPPGTCEQFVDIFDFRPPKDASSPGMVVVMDSEFGGGIPAIVGCSTLSKGACLGKGERPRRLEFTFSRNKLSPAAAERGPMPK